MRRRDLIKGIGSLAAPWPLAARAQPRDRMRLVGLFWGLAADDSELQRRFAAFAGGLQQLGWIEGKSVAFVPRYAVGNPDRFSAMAADLVQNNVDVIVAGTAGLTSLARKATSTIPIVAAASGDLEGTGLIASVRRPGGNVTGIQVLNPELMSKRVDLLKQLIPNLTRLGIVVPITPAGIVTPNYMERITDAARARQIQVGKFEVHSTDQFDATITMIARECQAAIVISNPLASVNAKVIADSAARNRLPTMYELRFYTLAGGLLSYGADIIALHRQAATYVDKILGRQPGRASRSTTG